MEGFHWGASEMKLTHLTDMHAELLAYLNRSAGSDNIRFGVSLIPYSLRNVALACSEVWARISCICCREEATERGVDNPVGFTFQSACIKH